jgi:rare lipoprotein A
MKKHILLTAFFFHTAFVFIIAQHYGNATYYNNNLHGRHTSDGGKYHPDSMTCAHLTYPFGSILKVKNPKNNREVIVKVTDRGPHNKRFMIDLSYKAAKELDIIHQGFAQVEITRLDSVPIWKFDSINNSILTRKTDSILQKIIKF